MSKAITRLLVIYLAVVGGILTRDFLYVKYTQTYGYPLALFHKGGSR